jgi:hypothetical protein
MKRPYAPFAKIVKLKVLFVILNDITNKGYEEKCKREKTAILQFIFHTNFLFMVIFIINHIARL